MGDFNLALVIVAIVVCVIVFISSIYLLELVLWACFVSLQEFGKEDKKCLALGRKHGCGLCSGAWDIIRCNWKGGLHCQVSGTWLLARPLSLLHGTSQIINHVLVTTLASAQHLQLVLHLRKRGPCVYFSRIRCCSCNSCWVSSFHGLASDPEKKAQLQLAEIKHARLAMVAFLGFAVQAAATGKGPLNNWATHLSDPLHTTIIDTFTSS